MNAALARVPARALVPLFLIAFAGVLKGQGQ